MTYLTRQNLDPATLVISLRFEPETTEVLLTAKIETLGELIVLDEFAVCQMLVADDLGFGMSNQLAMDAIQRFMRLRDRLDRLGLHFAGERHSEYPLFEMF